MKRFFPVGLILGFWFWTNVFKVTKKVDKKVAENKMKKEAIIQAEKDKLEKFKVQLQIVEERLQQLN